MRKDPGIPLRVRSRFVSPRSNGTDLIVSFLSDGSVQIMCGAEANDFFERKLFDQNGKWVHLPYKEPLEPA